MKKVFGLIEKESAKFAQLPFFEFLVNENIAFIQRLSFALCFPLFVMGYGDFNKFVYLEEATVDPIQYIVNNQNREEKNHLIWFLKDLECLAFNLFLNFTESLKFIYRQIIYELYSGSHSDAVQHYIARCKGTALPCPYGCTSRKREPLYRRTFELNPIYRGKEEENCPTLSARRCA